MINVKNVHKSFDGHVVLDNISVDMHDGQCNMIIGQSGSGTPSTPAASNTTGATCPT